MEQNKKSILIIEPSPSVRHLLSTIAQEQGFQVHAKSSPAEAAEVIGHVPVQLVTTATTFPSGSYTQVLQLLRKHPECEFTPIVLVTSDSPGQHLAEALAEGVTEIFAKNQLDQFHSYLLNLNAQEAIATTPIGIRALLLEDDRAFAAYVSKVLDVLGITTTVHHSSEEAVAATLNEDFDLILTDLVLDNGSSGSGFIRRVRSSNGRSAKAPIIAMSAFVDPARRYESLRAGADLFITKPFRPEELQRDVLRALDRPVAEPQEMPALPDRSSMFNLSPRERMICALVIAGHPDKYIAKQLSISFWTVRAHIGRIFRKCGVGNRVELGNLLHFSSSGVAAAGSENATSEREGTTATDRPLNELPREALHDPLTGLANRALLRDRYDLEMHRAQRNSSLFALLYLDLDNFKAINDAGNQIGDQALIEVAQRLGQNLRKSDTISRVGGDKFVALLSDLGAADEADDVARKVLLALRSPLKMSGLDIDLRASIGISIFPEDGQHFDDLLDLARKAVNQAKAQGGNRICREAKPA